MINDPTKAEVSCKLHEKMVKRKTVILFRNELDEKSDSIDNAQI